MRNFFQFLSEAKQSAASLEAKQKGLCMIVSVMHGLILRLKNW